MKFLLIFLSGFINVVALNAQISETENFSWNKIIIQDTKRGWTSWDNNYRIERENMNLVLIGEPDSILYKIDSTLIENVLSSIYNPVGLDVDPLVMFGKDSTWLIENAESLWLDYMGDLNLKAKIDSIAVNKLTNYGAYKGYILNLQGSSWTDDYPYVGITIIGSSDTLQLQSIGQQPYMLPWVGTDAFLNNEISLAIAKILPENKKSNKMRLEGGYFNDALMDEIYFSYLEEEIEFQRAKEKYKYGFKRLSKHFQIDYADICMMGSIEWGGFIAANCLELYLKDSLTSKNIQFSAVFGRRVIPHPLGSLIRKKDRLIHQLSDNPVYQYCVQNDSCIGEIHFVNRKSLSWLAKKNFLSDVKDSGQEKHNFKRKFRKAIFFELTENKNGKKSFSRWIFFRDGTIVLWQLNGDYLMNFPKDPSMKNGYICKRMNF